MGGCMADGRLDNAKFSGPLFWVGLYIAAGSLVCCVGMAADLIRCVANGLFRFKVRYFPLNSATLTFLSIATKFVVDLNTSMPGRADQLSKLSSMVLLCVAMNHFIPSLGTMSDGRTIASNVVALFVLVVTVIVNVCIQLGTGAIYMFIPEHAIVIIITVLILVLLLSVAYSTPAYLEEMNIRRIERIPYKPFVLENFIRSMFMDASINNPERMISGSERFTCSTLLCLLASGILVEAVARSFWTHIEFCKGGSDYRWSTALVLLIQATTALFGAVTLTCRAMTTTTLREFNNIYFESIYWKGKFLKLMEAPSVHSHCLINIRRWWTDSMASYNLRLGLHKLLCNIQRGITLLCRWIQLIPGTFSFFCHSRDVDLPDGSEFWNYGAYSRVEKLFVLKREQKANGLIEKGKKTKPTHLMELVMKKHSGIMSGFHGVLAVFSNSEYSRLQPRGESRVGSWVLPIVSLAYIAVEVATVVEKERLGSLLQAVREGLKYVNHVDNMSMEGGTLGNEVEAANIIWYAASKSFLSSSPLEALEAASVEALEAASVEALQAASTRSVRSSMPDGNNFDWVETTLSDILRACLMNLPAALFQSDNLSYEKMEDAFEACAFIWSQIGEDIIVPLYTETDATFIPPMRTYEWRSLANNSPLPFVDTVSSFHEWRSHLRSKVDQQSSHSDVGEIQAVGPEQGDEENQRNISSAHGGGSGGDWKVFTD